MTSGVGRARLVGAVAVPALLLGLTACTGGEGSGRDEGSSSQPADDSGAGAEGGAGGGDAMAHAAADFEKAADTALAEVDGTVSGVGLSEDDGVVAWEVELAQETPDAATVLVDARTGEACADGRT